MIYDARGNEYTRPRRCGFPVPEASVSRGVPDGGSCDAVGGVLIFPADEDSEDAKAEEK